MKKVFTYCLVCGKRINQGDDAILVRSINQFENEDGQKYKYLVLCTDEIEHMNLKPGQYKKIKFGIKKARK